MKTTTLTLLVFLLFSCSTKNSIDKEILKEIYFKEIELCKNIINEPNYIDSIIKYENITFDNFNEMYQNGYYTNLEKFTKNLRVELLDILRYEVTNTSLFLKVHNLKIVYLLIKDNKIIDVVSFQFHFDRNRFKLYLIEKNPYQYYNYRRPKVKPYYPLMPPID